MSTSSKDAAVRPFRVNVPDEALADLRQRLAQTRLPDKETVADQSQGVPLKTVQQLLRYWQDDYDWRKAEARLNALPQFITEIDGLDINFIHARSNHKNALPIIVTHGWPGSIVEQLKIVDPLTNPTAQRAYPKLVYYNKLDRGGHFAAWEQPQLFSEEVRAGFRPLRG